MRSPAILLVAVTAAACPAAFCEPASLSVTIDTSGAQAVLQTALADPAHVAEAANRALANPAVRALISKMAKYDKTVTAESFRAAAISLANGGSADPFDLARLRRDPAPTQRMLALLESNGTAITARIASRLKAFAPDGVNLHSRLIIVVGSKDQNGWVPVQNVPDFYVDLGFHGEEVDSIVNIATHELFHVVQGNVQPDWTRAYEDAPRLPPTQRGQHRAHAVLLNLLLEGTATYVGDPTEYASPGPQLTHDQRDLRGNLARADQIFALFDTIVYRARYDPEAPLDQLLTIGFGGRWDETGYYVGYRMAKVIDRYLGRDRLRALVKRPPEDFVADYIALSRGHPQDPEITPLATSTDAIVAELRQLGYQRP